MIQNTTGFTSPHLPWGAIELTHFQKLQHRNLLPSHVQLIITIINLIGLHWKHKHTERIKSSVILM
jgi:hypothetical protein